MHTLVLGGRGYIGTRLVEVLTQLGYEYEVYDLKDNLDIRDIDTLYPAIMRSDTIVHLAGLSNDQAVNSAPIKAWQTNYEANKVIADLLKHSGKRLIFASSCSVYGDSDEEWVTEESKLNPLLMYAKTKALSEELFLHKDIDSVVFRFSTVCGYSPKMRWDLVVNTMVKSLKDTGEIVVNGGSQWRPLVDVGDVCSGIIWAFENGSGVYNLGDNSSNYQIADLGKLISTLGGKLTVKHNVTDQRSYRVSFYKLNKAGFKTSVSVFDSARSVYESL